MQKSILKYNEGITMNILKSSYRNFFKVAVAMSVFSLPSIGASNEISSQLLDKIQENINDNFYYSPKVSQKSKQDNEILINTSWELSYSINGTSYNSKMDLANYENTEGNEAVVGNFYRNKNGTGSDEVACLRVSNKRISNALNIDYLCAVVGSPILSIGFKISGRNMTNGIIGSGNTIEETSTNFADNNSPVTGNLIDDGSIVLPPNGEASFDEVKNELLIPVVNYKGGKYRVILQDSGNFVFTIKEATPAN
jgi:hypothetical protein